MRTTVITLAMFHAEAGPSPARAKRRDCVTITPYR
jgi:hypothetical protein